MRFLFVFLALFMSLTCAAKICSYHGGSEIHHMDNLKLDMSVTTNTFGLIDGYYETLTKDKFDYLVTHYPPTNDDQELQDAYKSFLHLWTFKTPTKWAVMSDKDDADWALKVPNGVSKVKGETINNITPIFGNGATELIDIIIRNIPKGDWKMNNVDTQYREYNNACLKTGRKQLEHDDLNAALTIVINPNNPTGDFMEWSEMVNYISKYVSNNSYLIVDESMLFWHSPNWIQHSFIGHIDYVKQMNMERNIKIIVIQSWTKIFSSTGIRIGSAVIFDDIVRTHIQELLPPWSLNAIGRDYIMYAFSKPEYLEKTRLYTTEWRLEIYNQVNMVFPDFTIHGESFLSWLWIDTHDAKLADLIVRESKRIGYPIRHGKQGYNRDTYIRIAVRDVNKMSEWFDMLRYIQMTYLPVVSTREIRQLLVIENRNLPISQIMKHEQHNEAHADALYNYLIGYNATIQTIVVGAIPYTDKYLLVDGHHRMSAFSRLGYTQIPVTIIDYFSPIIWTTVDNSLSKEDIIETALRGELMSSKATKHMIQMGAGHFAPIIILSEYTWS